MQQTSKLLEQRDHDYFIPQEHQILQFPLALDAKMLDYLGSSDINFI